MILFEGICAFFEFIAQNDVYVAHIPNSQSSNNRFSRFKTESLTGNLSTLGFPRLEIVQLPTGNLTDFGSSQHDTMNLRVRVIDTLPDKFDFNEEMLRLDNCKKALMRCVNYIREQQDAGTENDLLCAFDINSVKYQLLDKATLDGKAVGCQMDFQFKECINWEAVSYGTFSDTSKKKYTQIVTFDAVGAQNAYTAADVDELEDMSTWTLKVLLTGGMSAKPITGTWDGTTLTLQGNYEGGEYIVCFFEKQI